MCGAGKSCVSDYLVGKGYKFLRFGQITLDEVKRVTGSLEPNHDLEKEIRERNRREHGMAAYAILNKPKIDELLILGNVVIDGLYSWSEYKYLKEIYKDSLKVIAVLASPETRYDRLEDRKDIDKEMRNRPMLREESISRDYAEIENIEKGGPIAMADIVIINNGSKKELIKQLENISSDEKYIRPSWDEYFMEVAKAIARRATCDRGRMGCVISRDKQLLVTGYVGSPIGLPHCDEGGHVLKEVLNEDGNISKHCVRTIHGEQNALCQAAKLGVSVKGGTLYTTLTPCNICAKMLINSGIKRIVCEKRYHRGAESEELFKQAGVQLDILDNEIEKYKNQ
ncbi:MAG TPA: hypothetical protein ENG87_05000 [Candidatus Pacearchaeota archaeon]|nr:hypothetical protein [Candidatus Pacearchaeota archaeon]HDZ60931.1 hypothetical protein [Candidatus Pacearchaeota archaeon]